MNNLKKLIALKKAQKIAFAQAHTKKEYKKIKHNVLILLIK
jgi:uncharacterized pyridoxamine 5'-phosphate oxidase family protein